MFVHNDWKIAEVLDEKSTEYGPDERITRPIAMFLAAYVPLVRTMIQSPIQQIGRAHV